MQIGRASSMKLERSGCYVTKGEGTMKKDFSKEVKLLLKHIEKETAERDIGQKNRWVVITMRDIPKITGTSIYYANKIIDLLKRRVDITHKIAHEQPVSKKPYKFRQINPEEKIHFIAEEENYDSLSTDDVIVISSALKLDASVKKEYKELLYYLSIIDFLLNKYGRVTPFVINRSVKEDIVDELLVDDLAIDDFLADLVSADILRSLSHPTHGSAYQFHTLGVDERGIERHKGKTGVQDKVEKMIEEEFSGYRELITRMDDFRKYIHEKTQEVADDLYSSEIGFSAINKLKLENKEMKDTIEELEKTVEKLNKENLELEKLYAAKEYFMQMALQEMLGDISNILGDFQDLADWERTKQRTDQLEQEIVQVVTQTIEAVNQDQNTIGGA